MTKYRVLHVTRLGDVEPVSSLERSLEELAQHGYQLVGSVRETESGFLATMVLRPEAVVGMWRERARRLESELADVKMILKAREGGR